MSYPDAMMMGVPLQNRVLPTGEIVRDPGRGLLMGNRGCLHGRGRELGTSRWRSHAWICCVLDWRGRERDPMPPGRWTALFFLDEATALAAGHRPCAYCRRDDFLAFATAWRVAAAPGGRPRAAEMDAVLHDERVDRRTRAQITHAAAVRDLPDGVLIRDSEGVGLLIAGGLRPWSSLGYAASRPVRADVVDVLTPPSTVTVLANGYRPLLHPSADAAD